MGEASHKALNYMMVFPASTSNFLEGAQGIEPDLFRPSPGVTIRDCPRCVGRSVGPIGPGAPDDQVPPTGDGDGTRQHELLTTAPLSFPADRHRGLSAEEETGGRGHAGARAGPLH